MEFKITPLESEADQHFFQEEEYRSYRENFSVPTDRPEEEVHQTFLADLEGYTRDLAHNQVYLAKNGSGEYAGMIWVARRTSKEPWDFSEMPGWIYDIRVRPKFRRSGLGRQLLAATESWARDVDLPQIGLHVLGENAGALSLYRASGFRAQYSYYQKDLTADNLIEPDTDLIFRPYIDNQDQEFTRRLLLRQYRIRAQASADPSEEQIEAGFEKCLRTYNFGNPEKQIIIAGDRSGTSVGLLWFYQSKGDLGKRHYIWMHAAQAVEDHQMPDLLSYVEQWALEHDLDAIRTPVHRVETRLTEILTNFDYHPANIFMYKYIDDTKI